LNSSFPQKTVHFSSDYHNGLISARPSHARHALPAIYQMPKPQKQIAQRRMQFV